MNKLIIAGPCTVESEEQIVNIALKLKSLGVEYLRGGCFKPRTNPESFQGLRDEGIRYLLKAKEITGMKIVTELMSIEQVRKYASYIDIIQVGTRNMYNYELLKELSKYNKPIILKRSFGATYNEWINAAKYLGNNPNIILCERGIKTFETETRNTLDISAIPYIKNNTNYKIIVDPSHACGNRYMIKSLSKASIAAGADGLLIEVHTSPDESICDSKQTISIEEFKSILESIGE